MVYRGGSLAAIVGKDYAKELDGITAKWRKVVRMDETILEAGEPLGSQFATFPHTFKRRCDDMVMSLSGEHGIEMGQHIPQKAAMSLVAHCILRFE